MISKGHDMVTKANVAAQAYVSRPWGLNSRHFWDWRTKLDQSFKKN